MEQTDSAKAVMCESNETTYKVYGKLPFKTALFRSIAIKLATNTSLAASEMATHTSGKKMCGSYPAVHYIIPAVT